MCAAACRMQEWCGPHKIDAPQRVLYRELCARLGDLLPFEDSNKIGDEDLGYRFLIARCWDVGLAAVLLREYLQWRREWRVDTVLHDVFSPEIPQQFRGGFHGSDLGGRPVYYERLNPKGIGLLLRTFDKETLLRWHFYVIERGRERYRLSGHDRLTIVLDAGQIGMQILTNSEVTKYLKVCIKGNAKE